MFYLIFDAIYLIATYTYVHMRVFTIMIIYIGTHRIQNTYSNLDSPALHQFDTFSNNIFLPHSDIIFFLDDIIGISTKIINLSLIIIISI